MNKILVGVLVVAAVIGAYFLFKPENMSNYKLGGKYSGVGGRYGSAAQMLTPYHSGNPSMGAQYSRSGKTYENYKHDIERMVGGVKLSELYKTGCPYEGYSAYASDNVKPKEHYDNFNKNCTDKNIGLVTDNKSCMSNIKVYGMVGPKALQSIAYGGY